MIKRCTRKTESGVIWLLAFLPRAKARGFPARDSDEYAKLYRHFKQGHLLTREDLANYPVISYI